MGEESPETKTELAEEKEMAASLSDTNSPAPPPPHAATPTSADPPPSSDVIDPLRAISATTSPMSAPPPPLPAAAAAAAAESEFLDQLWTRQQSGLRRAAEDDKYQPYQLFPEIELPRPPNVSPADKKLIDKQVEFEKFWKDSCYYLQPEASNSSDADIERYSDRFKKSAKEKREKFESMLKLTPRNFPSELLQDVQHGNKKLKLDQESVDQMTERVLERYAKIEEESKGKEGKVKRKKNEDDKNDSKEEEEEQVEEESESENDYTEKKIPSDDEDDYNMSLD